MTLSFISLKAEYFSKQDQNLIYFDKIVESARPRSRSLPIPFQGVKP
jgi:hypothetical protein